MDERQWNEPRTDSNGVYGKQNVGGNQAGYASFEQRSPQGYGQPAYTDYRNSQQYYQKSAYNNQNYNYRQDAYNPDPRQNFQQGAYNPDYRQNYQQRAYSSDPRFGYQQDPYQPGYNQQYQCPAPAYQQQYYGYYTHSSGNIPGYGLSIAGMILGICSLITSMPLSVLGLIFSIIGVVQAKKANMKNGIAVAGIIINAVVLTIHIIAIAFMVYLTISEPYEFYSSDYMLFI